jgi:integrase
MLDTGARCGEIGQLRVQDVKTVDGVLVLDVVTLKTTNRRDQSEVMHRRLVPVADKLRPYVDRVLAERGSAGPEALLFPLAGHRLIGSKAGHPFMRYAWGFANLYNRHAKAIADTHVHCWRSYAISQMARSGIAEETRRRVVGHSTLSVHDGYTTIDLKRLKEAVDTIA